MKNGVAFSLLHSIANYSRASASKVNNSYYKALISSTLLLGSLTSSIAIAQSPTTPTKPNKRVVDYTPAINELLNLGFPDIRNSKNLKYVKINDNNLRWNARKFTFDEHSSPPQGLAGNGFFIPTKDDTKPNRFIYMGGHEMQHIKSSFKPTSNANNGQIAKGKVTDADIKKDLQTIIQWAQDFTLSDEFEYSHNQQYPIALGYAVLAHQAGYKEEASTLIKILFLNHQNPEQMIDNLINKLAENEYQQIFNAFQQTTNWEIYHKDLRRLQRKFPRGWKNQPGLSILIPQVKDRINTIAVIEPQLKNHTFSPEIQKLLKQTIEPPKKDRSKYYNTNLFLINKPQEDTSAPAFIQLTQQGMEGFAAIASLIGNTTLLPPNTTQNYNQYDDQFGSYHSYNSYNSHDRETTPEQAYHALRKPQTIGSIALGIISSNLPHDAQTISFLNPDEYKDLALKWWKEHRHDSRIELIEHYMDMGNQSHINSLINSLAQENTEESVALLEKSILSSKNPSNTYYSVESYIKQRKTKADEFLTKYQAAVEKEISVYGESYINYQLREKEQREKLFTTLRGYTQEVDPEKLLKTLAKNNEKLKQTTELFVSAYDGKHVSEYINPIIQVAVNKEKPAHRFLILNTLLNTVNKPLKQANNKNSRKTGGFFKNLLKGHKRAQAKEAASSKTFSLTNEQKADWEKLVFSDEQFQNSNLSSIAGTLLDISTHPKTSNQSHRDLYQLGQQTANEIIRSRSKAILEGTTVPPLPNANDINDERYQELLNTIEETEGAKLREIFLSFSYSERIHIMKRGNVRDIFQKANTYIQGFAYDNPAYKPKNAKEQKTVLKGIIGKETSPETYLLLANTLMKHADIFANSTLNISNSNFKPGKDLHLYNYNAPLTPEIQEAQKKLLEGKIEAFSAITSYKGSQDEPQSIIITANTKLGTEELTALANTPRPVFSAVNKTTLEQYLEQQKRTKGERDKIINEIIEMQPGFESFKDELTPLSIQQLQQYFNQLKTQSP